MQALRKWRIAADTLFHFAKVNICACIILDDPFRDSHFTQFSDAMMQFPNIHKKYDHYLLNLFLVHQWTYQSMFGEFEKEINDHVSHCEKLLQEYVCQLHQS